MPKKRDCFNPAGVADTEKQQLQTIQNTGCRNAQLVDAKEQDINDQSKYIGRSEDQRIEAARHSNNGLKETARWKAYIENHLQESKKSAAKMALAIQDSPLKYELPVPGKKAWVWTKTLQIPKFFDQEDKRIFKELCDTFYSIFSKTIQAYKKDPAVRRLFRFSKGLEAEILRNPDYETLIPMLRIDIFYNEEDKSWQVCEFNTDGTSAMFENNLMAEFFKESNAMQALAPDIEYMELMDTWADAFLDVYNQSSKADEKPAIVITDILENAYLPELQAFAKLFSKRGYLCEVEDIRDLDYDGKNLTSLKTGNRYNAVYRRAVTRDIVYHYHDLIGFIAALSQNAAVMIGDLQTQIIHSKMISEALQSEHLRSYFTEEEVKFLDEHMPKTYDLKGKIIQEVIENKNDWIIKPKDGYAAKGVWAGIDVPAKLWKKLVTDFSHTDYIAQKYVHHYKSDNIDLPDEAEFKKYANMTGLYVYNGHFAGVYSRIADAGIISSQYNEHMVPTFFLKDSKEQDHNQAGTPEIC